MKTIPFYLACWPAMIVIGIANGTLRVYGYGPFMKDLTAHQLSTLTGLVFFGLFIWMLTKLRPLKTTGQALIVGVLWLCMTILFEFIFGHYIMGHTWSQLLHDYNILEGRIWLLILIWITGAPYVFYKFKS